MNLSIQEELGVLEKIKDNKQQKWKAERKQLLAHTQEVIKQLQDQIERSNDGQRMAQRQLQSAFTNAQKTEHDLQEQVRLLQRQNQELLASVQLNTSSGSTRFQDSPDPKRRLNFTPILEETSLALEESPRRHDTLQAELEETKKQKNEAVQAYQFKLKLAAKEKTDLEEQIRRMVENFADKEAQLLKQITTMRKTHSRLVEIGEERERTIQDEIRQMRVELSSLH